MSTSWPRYATTSPSSESQGPGRENSTLPEISAAATGIFHLSRVLKLFERIYAPLVAGLLRPFAGDAQLKSQRSQLDRLYQRVVDDLEKLLLAVGLKSRMTLCATGTKSSVRFA